MTDDVDEEGVLPAPAWRRDSMRFMLMPWRAKGLSTAYRAPAGRARTPAAKYVMAGRRTARARAREARGVVGGSSIGRPPPSGVDMPPIRRRWPRSRRHCASARGLGMIDTDASPPAQVLAQPGLALCQRHRVRVHALDVLRRPVRESRYWCTCARLAADFSVEVRTCRGWTGWCLAPNSPPAPRRNRRGRPRLPRTLPRRWPTAGRARSGRSA